jgi:hypothetical protein
MWCPPVRQKVASIAVGEVAHNGVTHFMTVNSGTQQEKNIFYFFIFGHQNPGIVSGSGFT